MRTGHRVVILIGLRLESCDWLDPLSDQKPAQWSAKATDKQLHAACFFSPSRGPPRVEGWLGFGGSAKGMAQ